LIFTVFSGWPDADPSRIGKGLGAGFHCLNYDDLVKQMRFNGYSDNYPKEAFLRGPIRVFVYARFPWTAKILLSRIG
jgi:hypothetical protein